jgi:carbon storage regulator
MLKISLKQGQYVNIGDNIRVVYVGGTGNHGRLMIDAPKEVKIARSTAEQNPERRKDTYYPEPAISKEAQDEIKKILWNERMKAETKKDAERMSH